MATQMYMYSKPRSSCSAQRLASDCLLVILLRLPGKENTFSSRRFMDDYQVLQEIGDGGFGTVYRGRKLQTSVSDDGSLVAIKKLKAKNLSWMDCLQLREVKALKKLNHPNIVALKEVIREKQNIYLIFELMDDNLHNLISARSAAFESATIKGILRQVASGLAYIHEKKFIHRDIKPENLLCKNGLSTIKIADFGLSKEIDSKPPFTDYVATRWYRAPELLLGAEQYGCPVDLWAYGCIAAELYILRALFPGKGVMDQLLKISQVLGPLNLASWPEGTVLISNLEFGVSNIIPLKLSDLIVGSTSDALDLIGNLLQWVPGDRLTARQALKHHYLND